MELTEKQRDLLTQLLESQCETSDDPKRIQECEELLNLLNQY